MAAWDGIIQAATEHDDEDWNPLNRKLLDPDADVVFLRWNDNGWWEQVHDEAAGKPGVVPFKRVRATSKEGRDEQPLPLAK